jgi:hypothetical protein
MFGKLARYLSVGSSDWAVRRRLFVGTWLFVILLIVGVVLLHALNVVSETFAIYISGQGFAAVTLILGTYTAGAIVDDNLKRTST